MDIRQIFVAISALAVLALVAVRVGNHDHEALCEGIRYERHSVQIGSPPIIELAADGVSGPFLLDFGATMSSLSARVFATSTETVKSVKLSLPSFQQGVFTLQRYGGKQLGVIGTDFLSLLSVQITESAVFLGEKPCQPTTMRAHGFVPISQEHFFGSIRKSY
jgi:hypothetical protein